ncbi:FAD-binding domain-containing protein [Bimuria novae-zelandiae CBS 107.79]|uniref:FAD-binding domain-containing protein n=1 Tax=Bimuria novae-zelandiae CBS 107.79 TaxID=1447943 RepID=A0A6A5VTT3_9PLEO|nr:FAD-binding domain-containing protein [Bimuria novae-zelandiae CBS 107.79]
MAFHAVLQEVLPEKYVLEGSDLYEEANGRYFTVFESRVKPAAIVQPTSAQEVSTLIKRLGPKLVTQKTSLAIKGTGHTPFAGAANVQGGITIASQGLKGLHLSENKEYVIIGVGETWGSVYEELEKHGLTAPGGRYGFACDSVLDFELVLGSGETVHANAKENNDLFICLKGGLNNFGFVTSFSLKTIPSTDIWGGVAYYMPNTFPQLIEATVDFVNNETDEDTHIMSSAGYGFGQDVCTCCMYHLKGDTEAPALQRFRSLPGLVEGYSTLRTGNHMNFCDELSKFTQDGIRSFYATLTIKPDVALMKELHQVWLRTLEPLRPLKGFIFSFGFFPLTKALLTNSKKAGDNAKDIDPADGPLFVILINPTWDLAENDEQVYSAIEDLTQKFKNIASERGLLHRYVFTNYGYHKEDVLAGYGERSGLRMRETSKRYDPDGIFQKAVPGGFKLPKA